MSAESVGPPAVLLLVSGLGVGGAERLTLQLGRGLVERGWRAIVVGLETDVELLQQFDTGGLVVRALNMTRRPRDILRGLRELARIVREERIGLIHAHLFHSLAVSYLLRLRSPRIRVVFTSHNYAGFVPWRALALRLTRPLRHADVLFGRDQHPGLNSRTSVVIPNGVETDSMSLQRRLPTPAEPTRFLYLGRLTPEKNVDLLIRAIGEIESRQGDMDPASLGAAELWIAGDGPERARLERLVAQAGLQERVRFLGMQSRIRPLFEHCQALVMASDYEGLPMAVLEAGASAMPVIAPPVGGLPAVLDDGCGYLVESPSLAEAMLRVMRDPVASQQVGARLRARVESRFSMRHCLDRHIELYQAVLR